MRTAWRSHFCGLCNTLRARYGLWGRWLINRDSTFLALTGSALCAAPPVFTRTTCCNPLGRKRLLVQHEPQIRYAAAVTVCALATKLRDDAGDERGLRRTGARTGRWLLRRAERKARADLDAAGFSVEAVVRTMKGQERLETGGASLATASTPTAEAYGAIFGHLAVVSGGPEETKALLTEAGAALGRMIYTVDAWEDYDADRRRCRFNPLPPDKTARREIVVDAVKSDLWVLSRAMGSLPLRRHAALLHSLAGPRLQYRTLTRLGVATPPPLPPPLPPEEPGIPGAMPPEQTPEKKSRECADWCVGCPGLCCCGPRRTRGARSGGCCDGFCCIPVPDCDGCDCPGCDCDCPCDC